VTVRWSSPAALVAVLAILGFAARASADPVTERISVNSAGVQANAIGEWWYLAPQVALSYDGALAAFSSDATNLVGRDRNRASDVFVRDRVSGVTERVSLTASGREANGLSFGPAMSSDGRFVAFLSEAGNLPGVARGERGRFVFLRDRQARTTVRIDVSSAGQGGRGNAWGPPVISADGRYVAFTSDAPNLAPGDGDDNADAFVRDVLMGATTGISLGRDVSEYDFSVVAAISRDGRFVALVSESPLAPGAVTDTSNVFLHDTQQSTTTWIAPSGVDVFDASRGAVSDDGSAVAFEQRSSGAFGVVRWERATGTVTCVSCWDGKGRATWDTLSGMSADGRRIAYVREGHVGRSWTRSVYLRDRTAGATERLSVRPDGVPAKRPSWIGGLSPDGRVAAFASDASNLVRRDTNRRTDLFVRGPL
jgi:Tol biopolymer transport system component